MVCLSFAILEKTSPHFARSRKYVQQFRRISIERAGIPVALYVWQQSWDKLTEMIAAPGL
jgi:hypothetical protein